MDIRQDDEVTTGLVEKEDEDAREGPSERERETAGDPQPSTSRVITGARKKESVHTQRKTKNKRGRGGRTSTPNKIRQVPRSMALRVNQSKVILSLQYNFFNDQKDEEIIS